MPTVVRASHADAQAIAELCNAQTQELYGEAAVDRDEVLRWFALPNLHLWVAKDQDGALAAYADVHEEDERRR